jgi:hypothetical protein
MNGHGYTWEDVRQRVAADLKVGDTWVIPSTGTAYFTAPDGRVRGAGLAHPMPLDGVAWTATARKGDMVTARSHDGREATKPIPAHARLLLVQQS